MLNKKILLTIISLSFFFICSTSTYAITQNQSTAIQNLLDEACKKSNTPGISIAIVSDKEASFFSSGYSNLDKKIPANEQTIFELASVSKAFTALGILKLEKQGLLSRSDNIQNYLPWLSFNYQGKSVDMNQLTINNFLNHTSGLTNRKHSATIPEGNSPDMLEKTVKNIKQADLAFLPGKTHEYGTVNYDVLGLLIEVVSGKSYEEFMTSEILHPLNLKNTYVTSNEIKNSDSLSLGYRSFFFQPLSYDAPKFRGNAPAGYLLSNSKDLARWMSIQLNQTTDIPSEFTSLINESHQQKQTASLSKDVAYGAGWFISTDGTMIFHPGRNPNFAADIHLFPKEKIGISLLANNANANPDLVLSIKSILNGNLKPSYSLSRIQQLDICLTIVTIICSIFFLLTIGLNKKIRKNLNKPLLKQHLHFLSIMSLSLSVVLLIISVIVLINHRHIFTWQPYSIATALVSSFLLLSTLSLLLIKENK